MFLGQRTPERIAGLLLAAVAVTLNGCSGSGLPAADSASYRKFVSAFYVGLAGLQTGEDVRAKEKLTEASQLAPAEPATWANLALFSARQQEFDIAFNDADKAHNLSPGNSRIEALLGEIESKRGRLREAVAHLQRAVELDSKNLKARYALAEETGRLGTPQADADSQNEFQKLLAAQPDSIAVRLEVMRLAAKRGDNETLQSGIEMLEKAANAWPAEAKERLTVLKQTAQSSGPQAAAVPVAFLRNVLARVPAYRQSLNAVKTPSNFIGEPFTHLLKLPTPDSTPAVADTGLRFTAQTLPGVADQNVSWAGAFPLDDTGRNTLVTAEGGTVHVAGGANVPTPGGRPVERNGVLGADLNYDFKTDLVVANSAGVRLYQQRDSGSFADLTPTSKLPPAITNAAYSGAWAFDVDLDGDLDIVLGSQAGDPAVLRNNGDGTFAVVRPFSGCRGLVSFAAADIDGDGDPDVAMVDSAGALHVFANQRLGEFRPRSLPSSLKGSFLAVAAGDVNGDGLPDFLALRSDGSVLRLSDKDSGAAWDLAELIPPGGPGLLATTANLILADLDNNGSLDIVAGNRVFLGDSRGYTPVQISGGLTITAAVDLNNNGHLDLIGFNAKPVELVSHGTKDYRWQTLRVRAAQAVGDQRINSFGIGGEIEVRSGLLTQKQIITSPVLHFGLGASNTIDVARIVWPNGSVQAEFELKSDQTVLAQQRLKGSCPFLFAWNGTQMHFVKDGEPWSPALGLHINAQSVAGITQTQEWFKVPGDALVPHDGYYDLRVTAELWESYYIDHYSLLAVDHPASTEVFTDERFSVPPPALKVYTVSKPQPFASVTDDRGHDVSRQVRTEDGTYLDTFGRGRYQGVTRDHWVEVTLPDSAPLTDPLYLIASGWMHPTDGTVNVALGQSSDPRPQGLQIEVPGKNGNWVVAKRDLGFLAGRMKTAVIEIDDIFRASGVRRLRLRTNLEIYWDRLAWAPGLPDSTTHLQRTKLTEANLGYRGFSVITVANASSPEIPDYNRLEGTVQKWRDLEGYYTRFGDVRELLEKIDDRMVIMNAGDELRLRFAALPAPSAGLKRDFVMVGDGWIKDGDYNSVFSKTVLPIPYHSMKDYTAKPSTLEHDLAYGRNPRDWQEYHTRFVSPEQFLKALRN